MLVRRANFLINAVCNMTLYWPLSILLYSFQWRNVSSPGSWTNIHTFFARHSIVLSRSVRSAARFSTWYHFPWYATLVLRNVHTFRPTWSILWIRVETMHDWINLYSNLLIILRIRIRLLVCCKYQRLKHSYGLWVHVFLNCASPKSVYSSDTKLVRILKNGKNVVTTLSYPSYLTKLLRSA